MIDPHRVQRALFLAQLSPACSRLVFAGPSDACSDAPVLGLDAEELALLRALDPVAVGADRHGKRMDQLLGNTTSEYRLTTALAVRADAGFLDAFLDHPTFRAAILEDTPLPLAFGSYATGFARERADAALGEIVRLELALVEARRGPRSGGPGRETGAPAAGEVALAPEARLVELADGTVARAARLRAALDAGGAGSAGAPARSGAPDAPAAFGEPRLEDVLLFVPRRPRHGLPEVTAERLEPLVAALLKLAHDPVDERARDAFAATHAIERADLDAFVEELAAEGVLARGP